MELRDILRRIVETANQEDLYLLYMAYRMIRENAGLAYDELIRLRKDMALRHVPMRGPMPPLVKRCNALDIVKLPEPEFPRKVSVEDAIRTRRSIREYTKDYITLSELSTILYLSVGITAWEPGAYGLRMFPLRAYPSAGALQPVEVYVYADRVTGLRKGIYHYNPVEHSLELLKEGDYSRRLAEIALGQRHVRDGAVVLILTIYWARTRWKYGDRGYRYALLDAGFAGENIYLACQALGLGTCAVGAFFDDELCELLEIDCKDEIPVLMFPVGRPARP